MSRCLFALPLLFCCLPAFAQEAAEERRFDVMEYVVEGNSVLPALTIEKAVYPFLGEKRDLQAVEGAREALEKAYHEAGYLTVLVDIPDQQVAGGVVQLKVVEGSVERLKISGSHYFSLGEIRRRAPALAVGEVPQFSEVQQQLARLSRTPDRQINPLLRAGKLPGTVEVELKVEDRLPLHGAVEINSKQSQNTERGRLEANIRYDNLWQKEHSVSLSYITAPEEPSQVSVLVANYTLPVDRATGAVLALYGVRSDSDVPTPISNSSVLGKGTTLGMRYVRPLPGTADLSHTLSAGIDYKDFKEDRTLDASSRPITYVPASLQYNATLADGQNQWQFGVGATLGLRGFYRRTVDCDGETTDQFDCKRAGANANFATFRGEVTRQQALGGGWTLVARLDGQYSSQPLISNEQYAAGGEDSVRGYYDAERMGDRGIRGRLEVQTPAFGWEAVSDLRFVAFYDAARLSLVDVLPGEAASFTLAGTGLGLKLKAGRGWNFYAYGARALRDGDQTDRGDIRVHARLAYEF